MEADKLGLGKVEHVSVSVPVEDFALSESALRVKCRIALLARGVLGGCMIFHGFRIDRSRRVLIWSAHYHVLGYIEGGFDVCRECVHDFTDCRSCKSFKGREVREYEKDRCIVKVLDERKTVFGTAWYQLHHATIRLGIKRFQSVTWFGVLGYRKLKGQRLKADSLCPACGSAMTRMFHVGKSRIVKDVGNLDYVPLFVDDEFDESGLPNYVDSVGDSVEQR
jgi:hypothetical protein